MRIGPALVAVLLCVSARTAPAEGTLSLQTTDLISTTTISSSTTIERLSGLTFSTVTVGTVALALDIEDIKSNAQSPHHNVIHITNGVSNTASVVSNAGLMTLQQIGGGGNVTMSFNHIVVGAGGLVTSAPSITPSSDPTLALIGLLNMAFTVNNSFWFARVLNKSLLGDGFIAGSASPSAALAEDAITIGMNEARRTTTWGWRTRRETRPR